MTDVLNQVNTIFINVLEEKNIILEDSTTVNDIKAWDSLNNIQIVVGIEKHFNIRFTSAEIQSFRNVGEMCVAIKKRIQSNE